MGYQHTRKKRRRKRRRHDDELLPMVVNVKDPVSDVQNALKNPEMMKNPDTVLAMQSVLGNQAVQRALDENANKETHDKRLQKRLDNYKKASAQLDNFLPRDNLLQMMELFKEIGHDPEQGFYMDIWDGKYPEFLPVGDDSVFTLNEADSDKTGKIYFLSDDVKLNLLRLQMIMMMALPEDPHMQKIMSNPLMIVSDLNDRLLGATGLENSQELNSEIQVNALLAEYPAIARFLTEEQGKKLMEINPDMFRILLEDILPDNQLEELIQALKAFLKMLKNLVASEQLMKKTKWNEAKQMGMLEKDSSTFDQVILQLSQMRT